MTLFARSVLTLLALSLAASPAYAALPTNPLTDGTINGGAAPSVTGTSLLRPASAGPAAVTHSTPKSAVEAFCQALPSQGASAFQQLGASRAEIKELLSSDNGKATDLTMRASRCEVVQVLGKMVTVKFTSPSYDWVNTQMDRIIKGSLAELVAQGRITRDSTDEEIGAVVDEILLDTLQREQGRIPMQEMTVRLKMQPLRGTWEPTDDTWPFLRQGLSLQDARTLRTD